MFGQAPKTTMVKAEHALKGRSTPMQISARHAVLGTPMLPPYPEGLETALFALGCFWGAERKFWQAPGVHTTAVGYAGGFTPNPTYKEVCSGLTGHAEVVLVVFDPAIVSFEALLKVFWESHDPTQGMRQGADVGTQYRSAIFTHAPEQQAAAEQAIADLNRAGVWEAPIVTQIVPLETFYPAEDYHQEYFERHPGQGYCQVVIAPKVAKFRKQYLDRLKR